MTVLGLPPPEPPDVHDRVLTWVIVGAAILGFISFAVTVRGESYEPNGSGPRTEAPRMEVWMIEAPAPLRTSSEPAASDAGGGARLAQNPQDGVLDPCRPVTNSQGYSAVYAVSCGTTATMPLFAFRADSAAPFRADSAH